LGHLPGIKDDLNPEENLEVNARLAHDDFDAGFARETLIRLGLERQLMLPAMRLSAGQRRRVTLARLWLTKKPLWILDEPFTALDPGAVGELSQRIESHLDHGGICLYTTHQTVNIRSVRGRTLRLQDCEAIWA
jgi:heme exporter protein A